MCANTSLNISETEQISIVVQVNDEDLNKEGQLDPFDYNCAVFTGIPEYPFSTVSLPYGLIVLTGDSETLVGEAKFSVQREYIVQYI